MEPDRKLLRNITVLVIAVLVFLCALLITVPIYNRYQARANANNRVKVSAIEIRNQQQRVKIAKQHAEIRFQNAIGIREAQDEIAKTLTPLYVSFEQTEALKKIATSGSNNSVVFVPTNPANGLPIVPGITEKIGK